VISQHRKAPSEVASPNPLDLKEGQLPRSVVVKIDKIIRQKMKELSPEMLVDLEDPESHKAVEELKRKEVSHSLWLL